MRALSIRQPWAELIARGKKKLEYRTWRPSFRGDLLVVASAARQPQDCIDARLDPDKLVHGATVCVVEVWKVTGDVDDYRWHLRNPRRVEPVPIKGKLSIYEVNDTLVRLSSAPPPDADLVAKPRERLNVPRLAGSPEIVVMCGDTRLARAWKQGLRDMGCRVVLLADGYGGWNHLAANPAACVLLDAEVEGFRAAEVIARMRADARHRKTPVVVVGELGEQAKSVRELGRRAKVETVALAVAEALGG